MQRAHTLRFILRRRLSIGLCLLGLTAMLAAQIRATPADLEANYLRQIGNFMRLTSDAAPPHASTFDICIVGRDPFGGTLQRITSGEKIDDHPIRILSNVQPADARGCSIIYLSAAEHPHIPQDIAVLDNADVLTVSDDADFLEHGGMLQFVVIDNHVRFRINLQAVNRTHINLSADLLRLAVSVTGSPRQGVAP